MRGKKREFFKTVLIVVFIVMLLLIVAAVVYAFTHDLSYYSSPITTLAEIWCGVLTTVIGFYAWKAKTENCKKYGQSFAKTVMEDLCEKYGPEQAVPLVEALSNYVRSITDGK